MKSENSSLLLRLRRDENGAVIVLVAIMIVALIGLAALAVDVGNLAYTQRRLQATADMAALAGALELSCTTCGSGAENTAANLYSGTSGSKNAQPNLTITMVSGYPKGQCLTGFGTNSGVFYNAATGTCTGLDGYNAMEVQEQATVPFMLGQVLGFGPAKLTATSLAGARGTVGLAPLNVMIVLDTTASMNDADSSGSLATCGVRNPTRLQCATYGVRALLSELLPTQDQVGLMVFPQVSTGTVSNDYSCAAGPQPTVEPYSATSGATYQIVGVSDDYRSSNTSSTLNSSSNLATAAQYSSCAGVQAKGGEGTYYAGVINAAQTALVASSTTGVCATQKCQNVIIFLSDGGAGNASTLATLTAQSAAPPGSTTLTFTSSVPTDVLQGSSVADNTTPNTAAISSGTTLASAPSGKTVTLPSSSPVASVATLSVTGVSVNTAKNTTTLTFASTVSSSGVQAGMLVTDNSNGSAITTGTTVQSTSGKTVTLPGKLTVNTNDTIIFGGVAAGDSISFGTNNQCHEAITAAENAANTGTWIYSIAYGASTALSPNTNSCSDNEYPAISSCTTMQDIASDSSKFYSDGSGGSGTCASSNSASNLAAIFQNIGNSLLYTALLPNNTN